MALRLKRSKLSRLEQTNTAQCGPQNESEKMKTFRCSIWRGGVRRFVQAVRIDASNGYEAQKKAARYFKVKMIKVQVIECAVTFEARETFPA